MKTVFSFQALAACWAGLLVALGAGAVALQLTSPPAPPPVVVAAAAPPAETVSPVPPPVAAPLPFENRSLPAMLPVTRPALRPPMPAAPLPIPPVPPARHVVQAEPRRPAAVYAAQPVPAYDPPGWAQAAPYASLYARARPYAYPGPQTYYGW